MIKACKLVLAYGISDTSEPETNWINIDNKELITNWHIKVTGEKPERYGSSYVKAVYDIDENLNKGLIEKDLEDILLEYDDLINKGDQMENLMTLNYIPILKHILIILEI